MSRVWIRLLDKLLDGSIMIGQRILIALVVFIIGRYVVKLLNRVFRHVLERSTIDPGVTEFLAELSQYRPAHPAHSLRRWRLRN